MNTLNAILHAIDDQLREGNWKPHEKDIAYALGADLNRPQGNRLIAVVHSYLPMAMKRFEQSGERLTPVTDVFYREPDPELGTFGAAGQIPVNLRDALACLSRDGKRMVGLVAAKESSTLFKAYYLKRDQTVKITLVNHALRLKGFVERGWLEEGELDRIGRDQYLQLLR